MGVAVPDSHGNAVSEALDGFVGAAELGEGLGGHLVGRNVVGIVLDESVELGERRVSSALRKVSHREAVSGKGVVWVLLDHLGEKCDSIHSSMVRRRGWSWQANAIYTGGND
jgi:hypothetical protein